jgi:hypothetical protein
VTCWRGNPECRVKIGVASIVNATGTKIGMVDYRRDASEWRITLEVTLSVHLGRNYGKSVTHHLRRS